MDWDIAIERLFAPISLELGNLRAKNDQEVNDVMRHNTCTCCDVSSQQ